ncbi:MAG: lipopolysaccharide heptosyltransferase II [Candidatus Marinimicrobia bacterium]|nr:lipopolysaccharide heptosyltransferase II [Candidatus Neomarinimicrobiota bacterium]
MNYNKILVIQTAFLGDVIMSTPLIKALREIFPKSEIDILTIPATSIVFKENPNVTNILHYDKRKPFRKFVSFIDLIFKLRKRKYDLAVSIQSSLSSSFLMQLGKIPTRVGFARQKFVTIPVTHESGLHIRERYINLLKPFSDNNFDLQTEIFWSQGEEQKAQQIVQEYRDDKYLLGIAPGSVWNTKRWPKEYFAVLLGLLEKNNIKVILIGGQEDRLLCDQILEKSGAKALNLAGNLSVLESAAVIQKLDLMVTNDSASLHIANAVKTDVNAFFGPTVHRFGCYPYQPDDKMLEIDLYCRPCSKHGSRRCPEKHFRCMREIKPETAFEAIFSHQKGMGNEKQYNNHINRE